MSVELKNLKALLNFQNTTSTFKKLIHKYHLKKNSLDKHNKKLFLKKIEAKIQQLENEEKENDYIINEVRRNAQINKEILYSFGTKALNHIDEIKKLNVTSKMEKSKFFEPDKESTNIYSITDFNDKRLKSTSNTKYKKNKIINLPQIIIKSRNITKFNSKGICDSTSKNKNTDNKNEILTSRNSFNISVDNKKNKKEKNNDIKNSITPINKKGLTQNITLNSLKTPQSTDREENDLKNNNFKKRNIIIDNDYINYIQDIKNKFLQEEKKQERYFGSHKYGYDAFKLKYNYLQKKYFK